jgi:hypothetical protein
MSQPDKAQLSRTTADKAVRDCASLLPKRSILLKTQQKKQSHTPKPGAWLYFLLCKPMNQTNTGEAYDHNIYSDRW